MYHTSTKHIYTCMQSAHVGPSWPRMVAITHLLLLDRCGYYVDMRWLRLVGSLKLQVSCAEYRLFYRALLQKRPIILRSLLIVTIP